MVKNVLPEEAFDLSKDRISVSQETRSEDWLNQMNGPLSEKGVARVYWREAPLRESRSSRAVVDAVTQDSAMISPSNWKPS